VIDPRFNLSSRPSRAVWTALLSLFAPFWFATLTAVAAVAQDDTPAGVFGELIEVRVVNVEVVVTDKQGNRVPDLKPSDFLLKVDGKEVPIEYFSEIRGGQAIDAGAAEKSPIPGLAGLAPGSDVGTSYLVFIDDYFSIPAQRDKVLRSLKDDLSRLGPEDRMAIVAYDGKSVDMLSTWSGSSNALSRAFDQALVRRAHGLERVAELRSFEVSRRPQANAFGGRALALETRLAVDELQYARNLAFQVERSISAAVTTLRGFASPPGRKVMILLSGGWPYSPADYAIDDPNRPLSERDVPTGEQLYRPLTDTANLLGYTVYPVDVPGLDSNLVDASLSGSPRNAGGINQRENEIHSSLQYVASETGGTALLNATNLRALDRVNADTRSYYWLGFTPQRQGNDARHRIEVDARDKRLKVRARDSFRDLSRSTEVGMMVESALYFGNPPGSDVMPLQVGAPELSGRREIVVPVTLAIPVDAITVLPIDGRYVAQLELRVAAVDERGDRSEVPMSALQVTAKEQPEAGSFLRYDTKLRLRNIQQRLVVSLFDPASGRLLASQVDISPPSGKKAAKKK
jgi:VWFA-related protein